MTIRAPIFDAIRDARGRGWQSGDPEIATIDAFLTDIGVPSASSPSPALPLIKVGLTDADFQWAAQELGCQVAQIRAVDEVESGGGWFTDMRAEILDVDGPGGFVDGQELPKILFEAHKFDAFTGGRFRASHPNISSKGWNRALYAGGQAEYVRLHRAMQLDRVAALKSASVGRYQIMGFNHAAAGFNDVEAFWSAMKSSERAHLEAFVAFIRSSNLVGALRRISIFHADCVPFAKGYNGSAFAANDYHRKIARAFKKWSEA